jgi:hypothetical protein
MRRELLEWTCERCGVQQETNVHLANGDASGPPQGWAHLDLRHDRQRSGELCAECLATSILAALRADPAAARAVAASLVADDLTQLAFLHRQVEGIRRRHPDGFITDCMCETCGEAFPCETAAILRALQGGPDA